MPQKEEDQVIREKIKDKPLNKKKALHKGMATVGYAILFGAVSCLVFCLLKPVLETRIGQEKTDRIEYPKDIAADEPIKDDEETAAEDESNSKGVGTKKEDAAPEPEKEKTVYITEQQTLSLQDYQKLQNQLYYAGRQVNKAIVTVTGITEGMDIFDTPYEASGQTSGIIIGKNSKEIYILTEHQVVIGTKAIHVTFANEDTLSAKLKKYDGNTGIAILSIPLKEISDATLAQIQVVKLGNSLNLQQGETVIAVGSPLGTNYSILTGSITSVANKITTLDRNYTIFTTDVISNSRGSGALINLDREVVGLILPYASLQREENTLTAISVSELKDIIEMLCNGQDIPYIGLKCSTVTEAISEEYDIPQGVYIKEVALDSPAMEAGLQNGDVIVSMDGKSIRTVEDYQEKVLSLETDDEVAVTVRRQSADEYRLTKCTVQVSVLE